VIAFMRRPNERRLMPMLVWQCSIGYIMHRSIRQKPLQRVFLMSPDCAGPLRSGLFLWGAEALIGESNQPSGAYLMREFCSTGGEL
jgi:hypothetical protein